MSEQEKQKIDEKHSIDEKRRQLLKIGAGTFAGVSAVAGAGSWLKYKMDGVEQDGFPQEISPDFRRMDQRDVLLAFSGSQELYKQYPERPKFQPGQYWPDKGW